MFKKKTLTGVLILAAVLTAALVWQAPEEKTLGSGIKVVYIHVALIWTGMSGIVIAGLLAEASVTLLLGLPKK